MPSPVVPVLLLLRRRTPLRGVRPDGLVRVHHLRRPLGRRPGERRVPGPGRSRLRPDAPPALNGAFPSRSTHQAPPARADVVGMKLATAQATAYVVRGQDNRVV